MRLTKFYHWKIKVTTFNFKWLYNTIKNKKDMESIELLKSMELILKGDDKISYRLEKSNDFITLPRKGEPKKITKKNIYLKIKIYDSNKSKFSYNLTINKVKGLIIDSYYGEIVIESGYGSFIDRIYIRGYKPKKYLKNIFKTIQGRELDSKNTKYSHYISDIKLLIDPSVKRDGKIEDILK